MNTLRAFTLSILAAACLTSVQAQGLRAEVGKPLQQASELLKAGKAKEALAKVREADAVGGKTARRAADHRPHEGRRRAARRRHRHGHPGPGRHRRQGRRWRTGPGGRTAGLGLRAAAQQRQGQRMAGQGRGGGQQQRHGQAVAELPAKCQRRLRRHRQGSRGGRLGRRTGRPSPRRRRPAAPGRCPAAHRQQRRVQQHAGEAAQLLPEEGLLERAPEPAAAQARLR